MHFSANVSFRALLLRAFVLLLCAMIAMAGITIKGRVQKKSFSSIGCMGQYDLSKFSRLDRICDECYQIYRDPEINKTCRDFCFKNDVFPACVDALLLTHEQKELNDIVDELLG